MFCLTRTGLLTGLAAIAALSLTGCSTFHLSSSPTAEVYENGERIGTTPMGFNLMSGQRVFTLKKYGYVEEEVKVSSLDSKKQHIEMQWVGRTRIDTQPPGAEVVRIEDDEVLGITPVGLHLSRPDRVILKLKGYESVERDLSPNESYVVELKPKAGFKSAFYKDIRFSSEQGPVEIYDRVAGERIGVAPVELKLEAGSALEYRLEGHTSEFALISRNAPHNMVIELEPLKRVTIVGPEGAALYRAGGVEQLGKLPLTIEVDGTMIYEIHKDGFHVKSVGVSKTSPDRLRVEMKAIPRKTIVTQPEGGEVWRLGGLEKLGDTPYETTVEGERVFEIRKKGYKTSTIGLGPDSPRQTLVPMNVIPRDDPDAAAIGEIDSEHLDSY